MDLQSWLHAAPITMPRTTKALVRDPLSNPWQMNCDSLQDKAHHPYGGEVSWKYPLNEGFVAAENEAHWYHDGIDQWNKPSIRASLVLS